MVLREFSTPPPGALGRLVSLKAIPAFEMLGRLRSAAIRTRGELAEELPKELELERFGLCSEDWSWDWGCRLWLEPAHIYVRSFYSYGTFRLPSPANLPWEDATLFLSYRHQVIDWNEDRVLEMRLGSNSATSDSAQIIAIKQFREGPWIEFLRTIIVD